MKPPITIDDHGDLSIFQTVKEAENNVEPTEVTSGDLVAYDSEGRLLRGHIIKTGILRRGVKLEAAETEPLHASELRECIIDFLARLGEPRDSLEAESLDAVIRRGLRRLALPQKRKP